MTRLDQSHQINAQQWMSQLQHLICMQSFLDPSDRSIFSAIHFCNYSAFIRRRSSIISSVSRQIESNGAHTLQGNNSFNGLIISVGQIPLCKPSYVPDVFFFAHSPQPKHNLRKISHAQNGNFTSRSQANDISQERKG